MRGKIYNEIINKQDGRCKLCGCLPPEWRKLAIDHDHTTNQIRGLLCTRCNIGVGWIEYFLAAGVSLSDISHYISTIEYPDLFLPVNVEVNHVGSRPSIQVKRLEMLKRYLQLLKSGERERRIKAILAAEFDVSRPTVSRWLNRVLPDARAGRITVDLSS